jgi:hypothetical protein
MFGATTLTFQKKKVAGVSNDMRTEVRGAPLLVRVTVYCAPDPQELVFTWEYTSVDGNPVTEEFIAGSDVDPVVELLPPLLATPVVEMILTPVVALEPDVEVVEVEETAAEVEVLGTGAPELCGRNGLP